MFAASNASEIVPIWFTFKSSAFAAFISIPWLSLSTLVTNRSSPMMIVSHSSPVRLAKSSNESSWNGSSMSMIGYVSTSSM